MSEIPNILLVIAGECDSGICHDCERECRGEDALGVVEDEEQVVYCRKCAEHIINQTAAMLVEIRDKLRGQP